MSLRVRFTPAARQQLLGAVSYIRQDNPAAAQRFRDSVAHALGQVSEYPESGRLLPEFPDLPHREVIVGPYRFFYRVKGRTIWIVGAWHSRQAVVQPYEEDR